MDSTTAETSAPAPLKRTWHSYIPWFTLLLLIIGIAAPVMTGRQPKHLFKEGKPLTHYSVLLLVACSFYAFRLFRARKLTSGSKALLRSPHLLWFLAAVGFTFLALDEQFEIHEKGLDPAIHALFKIKETPLTDRIDDAIVGVYGLIAAAALVLYRRELLRYRAVWKYIALAFAMGVLCVVFDVLSNDSTIFMNMGFRKGNADRLKRWSEALEDSFKIMAEAWFLLALCKAWLAERAARTAQI